MYLFLRKYYLQNYNGIQEGANLHPSFRGSSSALSWSRALLIKFNVRSMRVRKTWSYCKILVQISCTDPRPLIFTLNSQEEYNGNRIELPRNSPLKVWSWLKITWNPRICRNFSIYHHRLTLLQVESSSSSAKELKDKSIDSLNFACPRLIWMHLAHLPHRQLFTDSFCSSR